MSVLSMVSLAISVIAVVLTGWAARAASRQAGAARDQTAIQRDQVAASHEQTELQRDQVTAAREQTELQRALIREASQPYVWADIQPDMQQGTVLHIVVGNSGPTMAHNVRVTVDPGLPAGDTQTANVDTIERTLAQGLRSLAPGRVIRWPLGAGFDLLATKEPLLRTIRVEAEGPYGPLPIVEFQVDIGEWRFARDAPDGSLHHVRGAIKDLTKAVEKIDQTIRREAHQELFAVDTLQANSLEDRFAKRSLGRSSLEGDSEVADD